MKYTCIYSKKKATALFLVLCLLSLMLSGMVIKPNVAGAAPGNLQLSVGNYRGLSEEVTVPVSITNPSGVTALTFKVTPPSPNVTVKSVTRGAGLPAGAEMVSYIPPDKSYANVGIYLSAGSITQDTDLVNITFIHDEAEGSGLLNLNLSDITAFDADGAGIAYTSVNGYIDVKVMYGDLNRSDTVTVADALLAMNAVVGNLSLSQALKDAGNVSRPSSMPTGGNLTIYDVLLIAQYAAGVRTYFPVNDPGVAAPPPPPPGDAVTPDSLIIAGAGDNRTFTVGFPSTVSGFVRLVVKDGGAGGAEKGQCTEIINNSDEIDIVWNMAGIPGDTLTITHITQDQSEASDSLTYSTIGIPPAAGTYPVIGTTSTIAAGATDPSITITLGGDTFAADAVVTDLANWEFNGGTTTLTLATITRNSDTSVTIDLTGTAAAGTLTLKAKADALAGTINSNILGITVQ